MYFVYILKSLKDASNYIGWTENLKKRLQEHNWGLIPSTKTKKPFKLIWYCVFNNKEKFLDFEKYLKSGSGNVFRNKRLI